MSITLAILGLGGGELMVVAIVALILFGSKRIPGFAKGLGQALKEFKNASDQTGFDMGQSAAGSYGKPAGEALTVDNQTIEFCDPDVLRDSISNARRARSLKRISGRALLVMALLVVALLAILFF